MKSSHEVPKNRTNYVEIMLTWVLKLFSKVSNYTRCTLYVLVLLLLALIIFFVGDCSDSADVCVFASSVTEMAAVEVEIPVDSEGREGMTAGADADTAGTGRGAGLVR